MKLYTLDMNSLLDVSYASIKLFFLKKGKNSTKILHMFTSYIQPGSGWQGASSSGEGAGEAGSKPRQLLSLNSGRLCGRTGAL